ncbi:MucB/RseB C-terminal domain-containing protein [Calditerrivibrio nitroreducens]|uniref:Putative sigma E regulatory protein, MucB/RseB n=1 Tax=Calditerrivibrio nitroreducens (strain DSM 19672 / NBRC 101217 / Yu37-1) TaxID=768670 RepID=E4THP0_CALNY|nr:MucB/RseB C-terminal domain-containing protein [Calditerrivibrio nitroreducens]ADR18865.1 putative sigma E regulatory protein, MucB/RseB [Calditerrivibrio nitroreducens DSM 19672]
MKNLLTVFLLLSLSVFAHSETFFVKIALNENSYITLNFNSLDDINIDTRVKFIARMIREPFIDINAISKDYYNIKVKEGFKQDNKIITQYELIPIKKDRFSQIINTSGNLIVRREVYDTNNKLMYSYGYTEKIPDIQPTKKDLKEVNLEKDTLIYKGFQGKLIKKLEDGTIHYIFNDGLNKFSLFIRKNLNDVQTTKSLIYGNYLLSKKIDNIQYTVIGTIPFEEMEKFLSHIAAIDKKQ